MKILWNNLKTAFSMFSKIPVPPAEWSEENMRWMLCFFPWIGIVIGTVCIGTARVCCLLKMEPVFCGAILTLLPVAITGGIHLDGLLDTADALASWQEKERRLEILKDTHTGAFAVIRACCWFTLQLGAFSQLFKDAEGMLLAGLVFILSRSYSGLGVVTLPKASEKGTVSRFSRQSAGKKVQAVLTGYIVVLSAGMVYLSPVMGGAAMGTALVVFLWYRKKAVRYFGGVTGDLSGYFLCTCEAVVISVVAFLSAAGL